MYFNSSDHDPCHRRKAIPINWILLFRYCWETEELSRTLIHTILRSLMCRVTYLYSTSDVEDNWNSNIGLVQYSQQIIHRPLMISEMVSGEILRTSDPCCLAVRAAMHLSSRKLCLMGIVLPFIFCVLNNALPSTSN